jgi:hypothetical protein
MPSRPLEIVQNRSPMGGGPPPMTARIFSRQFHATQGAEAWRVPPNGA